MPFQRLHVADIVGIRHALRSRRLSISRGGATIMATIVLTLIQPWALGQVVQDGQQVVNRLTLPRAGVWLPGTAANSGHWWQPDGGFGFSRLDPAPIGSPTPFIVSAAANASSLAAKSGGMASVGIPNAINGLPANARLVFVPDGSSKSTSVVRFVFNPATETIAVLSTLTVANVTAVGGGTGGGRPLAAVLGPNGRDLYVGYKASGDIMMVPNATSTTPGAAVRIGSTSDGKGINAMTFFNNDLYITEVGGPALTMIPDPSGATGRPACKVTSLCTAQLAPHPGGLPSSPAGIASDASPGIPATNLYIGDAPLNGTPGIGIVRWNVGSGAVSTYSQNINPSYQGQVSAIVQNTNTYSQYVNPIGISVHPSGDVYVSDDPSFSCAGLCNTPALLQGHLWKIPGIPVPPTVTAVNPASGVPEGGTLVSISGSGFSTVAGATAIAFGGNAATGVTCSSAKLCSAVVPAGAGTQPVTVTVGGQTSAISAQSQFTYVPVTVTGVSPVSGTTAGGSVVTISGTGFSTNTALVAMSFGNAVTSPVSCTTTSCTVISPVNLTGTVDVQVVVTTLAGTSDASVVNPSDQFTYVDPNTPFITSLCVITDAANPGGPCSGTTGITGGGTVVKLTGGNLAGATAVTFGGNVAINFSCSADGSNCVAYTPPSSNGAVNVDVRVTAAGQTSLPATFSYANPSASVYSFGITAPKGGMVWIPGAQGGHWWSSDHANGFCRLDGPVAGGTFAINYAVCDDGSIGSPGQAAYDPRISVCPAGAIGPCHYVYVPDNAVKSTAVWRLTIDSSSERVVGSPEAMIPLANVRTLKPNGMALGTSPDGSTLSLYITDLTEANIRRLDGPEGDPRLQTLTIIGQTGDGRGANGTISFLGNKLYVSENRQASWLDVTRCTDNNVTLCSTAATSASSIAVPALTGSVPLPNGVFIAGVTTDSIHNLIYAADSPGGTGATIWRYNPITNTTAVAYLQGGTAPNPGATFPCATTCTRPTDGFTTSTAFSFAFGLVTDPGNGNLFITEDATAGNRSGRGRAWISPFIP